MAHINDLHPQDLYHILCLVLGEPATDIDEWKQSLPLLHVCSKWYDLLKNHVFSQAFVDVYPLDFRIYLELNKHSCIYYTDNNIVCRSNLGIIVGRDEYNCDCVSKLKVSAHDFVEIGHYAPVLENLLTLGIGYWINLTSLNLLIQSNFDYFIESKRLSLEEFEDNVGKYVCELYDRMPNIFYLYLDCYNSKLLSCTIPILIGQYSHRLETLHLGYSLKAPLPPFSTELTSLSLDLECYTHWQPTIYAKPLQFLELKYIQNSIFSWWIFHDFTTPGCIEFTNLKTLYMSYDSQTDEEKMVSEKFSKQARPYGSHMLRFPKLQDLSLLNPPVDCDMFYTNTIPTNMDSFFISGCPSMVIAASRLRFTRVNKLDIFIHGDEQANNDFYKAADYYFGYAKIAHCCKFRSLLQIDITRTISWVNITELALETIEFDNLLKLIPNLYKLRNLIVSEIYLNSECLASIRSGLEEEKQGVFELFDTRLGSLSIARIRSDIPHYLLALLNHLLLRTTSLNKVGMSPDLHSFVGESFLPDKFQYVAFGEDFPNCFDYTF